jgi:hypothetical protein
MSIPKVFVIQTAFNNPTAIAKSLERFTKQTQQEGLEIEKILYDCLYPLPNYANNRKQIEDAAKYYGWQYVKMDKNLGQNGNLNKVFQDLKGKTKRNDVIAFWEPDSSVNRRDWLYACYKCLADTSFARIGFITPTRHPDWILGNQGKEVEIAGYRCRDLIWPGGWPMGIYSYGFIEDMQELYVSHEYYGGTEANILNAINRTGYKGLMFCDITDEGDLNDFDYSYIQWKAETIHLPKGSQKDFRDWLIEKNLLLAD